MSDETYYGPTFPSLEAIVEAILSPTPVESSPDALEVLRSAQWHLYSLHDKGDFEAYLCAQEILRAAARMVLRERLN